LVLEKQAYPHFPLFTAQRARQTVRRNGAKQPQTGRILKKWLGFELGAWAKLLDDWATELPEE